jgi:hypothetical protein
VYAAVTLATMLSIVCWYFGIASGRDVKAYIGMALECHPVWQDLALHRVYDGQPVDDVIKQTTPVLVVRHGRFVELTYQEPLSFTGVQIVAMDGSVTRACTWSCTWDYTFFDSMTDGQNLEMSKSLDTNERTLVYNGRTIVRPPPAQERGVTMP